MNYLIVSTWLCLWLCLLPPPFVFLRYRDCRQTNSQPACVHCSEQTIVSLCLFVPRGQQEVVSRKRPYITECQMWAEHIDKVCRQCMQNAWKNGLGCYKRLHAWRNFRHKLTSAYHPLRWPCQFKIAPSIPDTYRVGLSTVVRWRGIVEGAQEEICS